MLAETRLGESELEYESRNLRRPRSGATAVTNETLMLSGRSRVAARSLSPAPLTSERALALAVLHLPRGAVFILLRFHAFNV